jgi:hypothetical protein
MYTKVPEHQKKRGQTPTLKKVPEQVPFSGVAPAPFLAWVSDPFLKKQTKKPYQIGRA